MSRKNKQKTRISCEQLLTLLKFGAILSVALITPNALSILKPLLYKEKKWQHYYPSSLSKTVTKLWRKGLVEIRDTSSGSEVKLTEKGQLTVLKFNLEDLKIETPNKWDGKWRIVFFDISEKHKKARNFLERKLKSLNFYSMQESVFIHPFPCDKQIKFIREIIGVPHDVKYGVLDMVENGEDLKRIFSPLLSTVC